jgi:hypothetical protein
VEPLSAGANSFSPHSQHGLFWGIHGSFRRHKRPLLARLYFHEAKLIAIPPDQVDLAFMSRRTEIAGDHHVPLLAKMKVGCLFAPFPRY